MTCRLLAFLDRLQPETRQIVCGAVVGAAPGLLVVGLVLWSLR